MSQTLLIALAASLPLAVIAGLAAWAVEAMGAGLKLRLRVWTAALLLPIAAAPVMLAIQVLDVRSPLAELRQAPSAAVASQPAAAPAPDLAAAPAPPPPAAQVPSLQVLAPMILLGVIGAGAALRLAGMALALARVARMAARSDPIADEPLASRLGRGVRQADNTTPILTGLLRPTILLPRRLVASLSPDQAALVCAHERAHLAAGDHLSHLMEETLVRLYWFNPFLAAVRERLAAAREEACDARALAGCDDAHRRAYAQTLIAALRLAGRAEPVAAFTGFRRRGAQQRLCAILRPPGPGRVRALLAAILAGLGLTAALGGLSLAFAAEPPAPPAPPAPPPVWVTPPAPPASPAAPAPPAPPLGPHHHAVIVMRQEKAGDGKDHGDVHTMVFEDDGMHDMHDAQGMRFDPDKIPGLTPQQRDKLKADMARAHAAMAQAMADSRQAMAQVHTQLAEAHMLTAEDRARVHQQVEQSMRQAHPFWLANNDGRVLMRCKLGPDGKPSDCEKVPGETHMFMMYDHGPQGGPAPPMPPMPGMPPMPPPPPPPPG